MEEIYKVLDVARYIINYSNDNHYEITNLKLQKILYFVQAAFLVERDHPCFEENIEAWDYGPVVPEVYHEYKKYGSEDLPYIKEYMDLKGDIWNWEKKNYDPNIIDEQDRKIIDKMVKSCKKYTANQLVDITHNQDPWLNSYVSGWNNIIDNRKIRAFFER